MPLSDAQWVRIEPLLPDRTPKRGGRWRNHREVIDAIAFKFQTGTQWVHLPEKYGNWRGPQPAANVGRRRHLGTRLHRANWVVSVDSTIVRAHQHAAGAVKGAPAGEPDDHAIGRSRGGLTTKLRPSADGNCRPLAFVLTAGQPGDAPAFTGVMTQLRVPRQHGRPRTGPDMVLADKAYSLRAIREHLRRRGVQAVIAVRADQKAHRR
ncbi:IS5 family transposase [Streptomyces sp. NPDC058217]|uniref:IS5 family transposase n=1 Tax=Streptomyces sp. NPDC058217 TaxID=3346384 RepID=UPI0036E8C0FD